MKLTEEKVEEYRHQVQEFGMEVALSNFQYEIASELMHDIGVGSIKTKYRKDTQPLFGLLEGSINNL